MADLEPNTRGFLVVGRDVPRTDAIPKVTGAAQYVADLHFPGMLHAAVLRSPHPHARIVSIDVSAAAAIPGVKAVATGADTARRKWGAFRPDLYPLAIDKVRYVGDEIAAVAAVDPETARAAVDKIVVRYEVLPDHGLGVMAALFGGMSLDEMLSQCVEVGLDAVELPVGAKVKVRASEKPLKLAKVEGAPFWRLVREKFRLPDDYH